MDKVTIIYLQVNVTVKPVRPEVVEVAMATGWVQVGMMTRVDHQTMALKLMVSMQCLPKLTNKSLLLPLATPMVNLEASMVINISAIVPKIIVLLEINYV